MQISNMINNFDKTKFCSTCTIYESTTAAAIYFNNKNNYTKLYLRGKKIEMCDKIPLSNRCR